MEGNLCGVSVSPCHPLLTRMYELKVAKDFCKGVNNQGLASHTHARVERVYVAMTDETLHLLASHTHARVESLGLRPLGAFL